MIVWLNGTHGAGKTTTQQRAKKDRPGDTTHD
jgi:adenylylsulfate kinase-like enzyme